MKTLYKRIFSFFLSVLLLLSVPLQILADTPGGSGSSGLPSVKPGGSGWLANPAPIFRDYGFRVTITDSQQLQDVLSPLGTAYTNDDLANQRASVENKLKHIYIKPGNEGIYFWAGLNGGISPDYGVVSSYGGQKFQIAKNGHPLNRIQMFKDPTTVSELDNELAWVCYEGMESEGFPRTAGVKPYNEVLGAYLSEPAKYYTSADEFLSNFRNIYVNTCNPSVDNTTLMKRIISNGDGLAENIRKFSWDTDLYSGDSVPAAGKVRWSQLGYITMLMQFAWLAKDTGNTATYNQFADKIWGYVCSGYSGNEMPLLEIEACQEVGENGTATASCNNCQLIPMSYMIRTQYGDAAIEYLYNGWNEGVDIKTALIEAVGTKVPVSAAVVGQGLGYYIANGIPYDKYADRAFHRLAYPSDDPNASYGYLIAFTYAATGGPVHNNPSNAMGSFTWKLDPKGVHDVTPNEEVNASSTVKEINMSQSGYNKNNYSEWESYVNG